MSAFHPRRPAGAAPARMLVAGFGNALRGDDGAGWHVAQALAAQCGPAAEAAGACILSGHQPVPEWVPAIAAADVAYFVDAGTDATTVTVRALAAPDHTTPLAAVSLMDGHALGVEGLLAMAQAVYHHAPEAYLVTLPVDELGFADRLSPRAQAAADRVVEALARVVAAGGGPLQIEEATVCV